MWKKPEVLSAAQQADIEEANAWLDRSRAEKTVTTAKVIEAALRQHFALRLKPSALEQAQRGHLLYLSGAEAEYAARIAVDALAGAGLVVVSAEDLREYLFRGPNVLAAAARLRAALPERGR
ncbi:hypothetical protein ACIBHX_01815 [Nonomuraea sp. NPDC050536]|uniref:hypothetical protein n=1 Tax=Nonomuraea sp. NPDC050536 TaxID=3364366 RepID=UPI0037C73593